MFKLLKSKKGFTLVELMIVVVIMAILVAVAVPIFSAVTKNARTKTCLANQREIQAQINNNTMGGDGVLTIKAGDKFYLETNEAGNDGTWKAADGVTLDGKLLETLPKLFQKAPYCPVKGNKIEVTIANADVAGAESSSFKITTVCVPAAANGEAHNNTSN